MSKLSDRFTPSDWPPLTTIVVLFVFMRLTILFFFTPQGLINAYSDYYYYFRTAQMSDQGYYPFINMWYEYPPLLAYLPLAVYRLTQAIIPVGDIYSFGYQLFARLLGLVFLIFETGVLILLYEIASEVWGRSKAIWLGWVYSVLSLPMFIWLYAHQVVVIFFIMLAIFWFITKKYWASAVALGLGVAAKLVPIVLLLPVVKFFWPRYRKAILYSSVVMILFLIQYVPFIINQGGPWVVASFNAISKVGSYGTIWAVMDGNWGPGTYGPLTTRIDFSQAAITNSNPGILPGWIILLVFALFYGLFFFRPNDVSDPKQFIWFSTLTLIVFFLYIKGWSPQWAVMLVPILLLSFPDHLGLTLNLLLTTFVFLEWPLNAVLGVKSIAIIIIMGRTILFISVLVLLVRRMWLSQSRNLLVKNL